MKNIIEVLLRDVSAHTQTIREMETADQLKERTIKELRDSLHQATTKLNTVSGQNDVLLKELEESKKKIILLEREAQVMSNDVKGLKAANETLVQSIQKQEAQFKEDALRGHGSSPSMGPSGAPNVSAAGRSASPANGSRPPGRSPTRPREASKHAEALFSLSTKSLIPEAYLRAPVGRCSCCVHRRAGARCAVGRSSRRHAARCHPSQSGHSQSHWGMRRVRS